MIVYYILRDHFSGSFVLEVATTNSLIPLADFLYYGWSNGTKGKYLWGMPDFLYVPQLISSPELFEGLRRLGVKALNPPSGFASGVRIVRDIEDQKNVPYRLPDYYSLGSEEEAIIYADGAKKTWQKTPGALAWLAGHL